MEYTTGKIIFVFHPFLLRRLSHLHGRFYTCNIWNIHFPNYVSLSHYFFSCHRSFPSSQPSLPSSYLSLMSHPLLLLHAHIPFHTPRTPPLSLPFSISLQFIGTFALRVFPASQDTAVYILYTQPAPPAPHYARRDIYASRTASPRVHQARGGGALRACWRGLARVLAAGHIKFIANIHMDSQAREDILSPPSLPLPPLHRLPYVPILPPMPHTHSYIP